MRADEQIFAKVDGDGNIVAFYLKSIPVPIPPEAVEITPWEWKAFQMGQAKGIKYRLIDGKLVEKSN